MPLVLVLMECRGLEHGSSVPVGALGPKPKGFRNGSILIRASRKKVAGGCNPCDKSCIVATFASKLTFVEA